MYHGSTHPSVTSSATVAQPDGRDRRRAAGRPSRSRRGSTRRAPRSAGCAAFRSPRPRRARARAGWEADVVTTWLCVLRSGMCRPKAIRLAPADDETREDHPEQRPASASRRAHEAREHDRDQHPAGGLHRGRRRRTPRPRPFGRRQRPQPAADPAELRRRASRRGDGRAHRRGARAPSAAARPIVCFPALRPRRPRASSR